MWEKLWLLLMFFVVLWESWKILLGCCVSFPKSSNNSFMAQNRLLGISSFINSFINCPKLKVFYLMQVYIPSSNKLLPLCLSYFHMNGKGKTVGSNWICIHVSSCNSCFCLTLFSRFGTLHFCCVQVFLPSLSHLHVSCVWDHWTSAVFL